MNGGNSCQKQLLCAVRLTIIIAGLCIFWFIHVNLNPMWTLYLMFTRKRGRLRQSSSKLFFFFPRPLKQWNLFKLIIQLQMFNIFFLCACFFSCNFALLSKKIKTQFGHLLKKKRWEVTPDGHFYSISVLRILALLDLKCTNTSFYIYRW